MDSLYWERSHDQARYHVLRLLSMPLQDPVVEADPAEQVGDAPPVAPLGRGFVEGMFGEGDSAAEEAVASALAGTAAAAVLAAPAAALLPSSETEVKSPHPDATVLTMV